MAEVEFIEHVQGLGDVYRCYAPYGEQLQTFKQKGINRILSVREESYARIHGNDSRLLEGTRTCNAVVCAKGEDYLLVRFSPFASNQRLANKATQAHLNGKWLYMTRLQYSKHVAQIKEDKGKYPENPEKWRAIVIPRGDFDISKDSETARFLWQDTRQDYYDQKVNGDTIRFNNLGEDVVDSQEDDICIVNYLWFDDPQGGSGLYAGDRLLDLGDWASGVLKKTSEAGSRSRKSTTKAGVSKLPCTQKQIHKLSELVLGVREGRLPASRLEKVTDFLEGLNR